MAEIPEKTFLPGLADGWQELRSIVNTRSPARHSPGPERLDEHRMDVPLFQAAYK